MRINYEDDARAANVQWKAQHSKRERCREERETVEDFCFVLRPERDPLAKVALIAYADACEAEYPALAADLRKRIG